MNVTSFISPGNPQTVWEHFTAQQQQLFFWVLLMVKIKSTAHEIAHLLTAMNLRDAPVYLLKQILLFCCCLGLPQKKSFMHLFSLVDHCSSLYPTKVYFIPAVCLKCCSKASVSGQMFESVHLFLQIMDTKVYWFFPCSAPCGFTSFTWFNTCLSSVNQHSA